MGETSNEDNKDQSFEIVAFKSNERVDLTEEKLKFYGTDGNLPNEEVSQGHEGDERPIFSAPEILTDEIIQIFDTQMIRSSSERENIQNYPNALQIVKDYHNEENNRL